MIQYEVKTFSCKIPYQNSHGIQSLADVSTSILLCTIKVTPSLLMTGFYGWGITINSKPHSINQSLHDSAVHGH